MNMIDYGCLDLIWSLLKNWTLVYGYYIMTRLVVVDGQQKVCVE
jgi:hypothetical protein